jgi:hypothetical protein
MQAKSRLVLIVGVSAAFSAAMFGQSIIEYGHGVGRAAAAGAASGTGIAGIFTKVKDTSEDDNAKKRSPGTVRSQEQTSTADQARSAGEPANAPLKMKTSSGVVVSGMSPSWMGAAYREPLREPIRVQTVEWANPAEEIAAAEQGGELAEAGASGQVAAGQPSTEESDIEGAGPARIVAPGHGFGDASGQDGIEPEAGSAGQPQLEAVTNAEAVGVQIGSRIDDVIRTLGRPTFSLTGIVGKNYTEKYVFKNAEGDTITVLTWAGVVTSVLLS